ncbi:hypothetical protein GOP47_0025594 [Adiantum capillus-veneris]|uniref:RING-type domain-containing protein n=1 Tax=Adiantum capillus-veneris TaxID=13818 RepID=A0A9D4Z330_ADICA|nr:hypothetical protein GOP47_0025594 [Adiantum capillus-veneris]
MEELGTHRTVTVHFVDGGAAQDLPTHLDADFALAKTLQEQEDSQLQDVSLSRDAFGGWASSSSMFTAFQKLKVGLQLKRDEALARALEDSDDQEQLMIMLSLQERPQTAPQIDRDVRQDDVDPDAMSYEELMGLTEVLGAQNKGLTPEEIRMLSVKKYKRCCFRSSKEEQCVICQQQYQRGDSIIPLPSCKHTYHKKCIRKWLEIKKVCPICNVEVEVH